jgi:hypothetical protein
LMRRSALPVASPRLRESAAAAPGEEWYAARIRLAYSTMPIIMVNL